MTDKPFMPKATAVWLVENTKISFKQIADFCDLHELEIKGILTKSIDEMELSVRSHNCLQAAGIKTISELVDKEENEMLKFKNFGRKSLTELQEKLGELDLHFGMDIKQYLETE